MKIVNITKSNRYHVYKWFSSFSNTTYNMTKKMDVTKLVHVSEFHHESFFIHFMYNVIKSVNSVEPMRMRLEDEGIKLYDPSELSCAYTVLLDDESYVNAKDVYRDDFNKFYKSVKATIKKTKENPGKENEYNNSNYFNDYYISCIPWVSIDSLVQPIPDDKKSQSVPRIVWDKYHEENGRYYVTLNIMVSHMFVDGYHLSKVFNAIQETLNNINE